MHSKSSQVHHEHERHPKAISAQLGNVTGFVMGFFGASTGLGWEFCTPKKPVPVYGWRELHGRNSEFMSHVPIQLLTPSTVSLLSFDFCMDTSCQKEIIDYELTILLPRPD